MIGRLADLIEYKFGINIRLWLLGVFGFSFFCFVFFVFLFSGGSDWLSTAKGYVYWQVRAIRYDGQDSAHSPVKTSWANYDGMTHDGALLLRVYEDKRVGQITALLADLDIKDVNGVARYLQQYKRANVKVDYYHLIENDTDYVVMWTQNGVPLNLKLIEAGLAHPMDTPPTNLVNTLMAQFYKNKL
ncbi:MAG: hypothetical protein ACRCXB_25850 [Aeromonadaceae bacterium]